MVKRGLISKKVFVLDCNCSRKEKQVEADRFDFCECKVRISKGKRGEVVSATPDLKYIISTIFVGTHPAKAWG